MSCIPLCVLIKQCIKTLWKSCQVFTLDVFYILSEFLLLLVCEQLFVEILFPLPWHDFKSPILPLQTAL